MHRKQDSDLLFGGATWKWFLYCVEKVIKFYWKDYFEKLRMTHLHKRQLCWVITDDSTLYIVVKNLNGHWISQSYLIWILTQPNVIECEAKRKQNLRGSVRQITPMDKIDWYHLIPLKQLGWCSSLCRSSLPDVGFIFNVAPIGWTAVTAYQGSV